MTERPTVSIVTPSLNQGKYIGETITSVLSLDYPSIEHIVIDACSSDNTKEILHSFSGRIHWISEPDLGQADAVNKGFSMAKGDIFGWLNSDDTIQPRCSQCGSQFLHQAPGGGHGLWRCQFHRSAWQDYQKTSG